MTDYIELHCHSYFSLLDGTSSPADLLTTAYTLGMRGLALTDHNNVYGAVEFARQAEVLGIQPILGTEITLDDGHHLTLLVKDAIGWQNLCWLITQAQHNAPKGEGSLPHGDLINHTQGLIALSGCRSGAIGQAFLKGDLNAAKWKISDYERLFGKGNFWLELQHHFHPEDDDLIAMHVELARKMGIPYVATNNVHYAKQSQHRLQDILVCIRHHTTLDEADDLLRTNSEYYLKSCAEMSATFHHYPEALSNTLVIASQCEFTLSNQLQKLPLYPIPQQISAGDYLRHLCRVSDRYEPSSMKSRLEHELCIIKRAGLENYFLVVWDIVRYARENHIRCQGRGSAANSVVAYLLNISPINPLVHDLVFERFLSDERQIVPDIDIDFDAARREEVIQYVYDRYGIDHAAMACTFITFRARSAMRDVGKTLGLSPSMVDALAKSLDSKTTQDVAISRSTVQTQLLEICQQIEGLPRHLGIHNGGMIITHDPITTRLPTEPATMPDRVVVQWDKESLEDAGIVKIDILGLRMLSAVDEAARLAHADVDRLTYDDLVVFEMISAADTIGVFQVESRAQMQMLPRFQPKTFADLIIAISLIRPGPIQGDMVHPYLRRRLGEEAVSYLHRSLEPALAETLGVILFQEQVLKVAHDLAGFTPGQGELLRRALGKKDATEAIREFEEDFILGAVQKGVDEQTARLVFMKLLGFGSYSFPKSHAAAFAVLVYQSAWLRCYHPLPFYVALLNNQPMGFYRPAVIVNDARRHGIRVLPVDVNCSTEKCSIESDALRLGFNYINGMGNFLIERVLQSREHSRFISLDDFCKRTRLPVRVIENLIQAGAMDQWGHSRRDLIWQLGTIHYTADELDLAFDFEDVPLPELLPVDLLDMEYRALGLSTDRHIMELYRDWLDKRHILDSQQMLRIPAEQDVTVAGLVVVRQAPPTAKGFQFITLEDEYGFINIIVRPQVYKRFHPVIRKSNLLLIRGIVQRERGVINVIASHFQSLPPL